MTYRSSSLLHPGSSGTSLAVPVPTGAAIGDIVVVGLYLESTAAVTAPSGFTNKVDLQTSAGSRGRLAVYWKRLTAADTGTYTFSWTGSTWRAALAGAWSGRVATGDPFDGTGTAETTVGATTANVSASPAAAGGDALHMLTNFSTSTSFTPPTNYTERQDIAEMTLDTRDNVAAGSTGNVSATATTTDFLKSFIGVLAAAASGSNLTVTNVGQAQSVQAVTLTQVHVLTVANAGQTQVTAATALTQVHQLSVANAGQAQSVASIGTMAQTSTLAPANVGQAQSTAAAALTQVHNLTVANVGQAQATASTALAQVHQLSVTNVGQAQSVAAAALAQVHQLAISGVGQAQGPGVPTLTQTHVLTVTGPGQAQAPGTVTLTQVHVLAVSGAGQTQATSSLTLTGPGNLGVANVGQSQLSAGLALTQTHNLVVSGVGQSQGPSSAPVVGPGQLAVSGVGQGQTVGPVVLTQAHQMVVAAAIQGQQTEAAALTQDHQLEIWSGPVQTQTPDDAQVDSGSIEPAPIDEYQWLTLGDLMDARATHESIMLDVISVRHPGMTEAAFDPDLGYAPATPNPDYYHGKATVQARQISAGIINPAGLGTLTQLGYAVHAPVGTAIDQAAPDDIIVVNESADPRHQDLVLLIKNVESSSFATARRLVCTLYEPSTP